ncbi:hypothetical protein DdX_18821 [Ditylenchus destructor]|uniref:Uncharacterized protein n=1 Tax=Ditylenchus destructor TaxID=166010 RepID=A0AAD4MK83_9BILA|nr:hypothetical protein DdX_18821 [Ditylenchus destructor]
MNDCADGVDIDPMENRPQDNDYIYAKFPISHSKIAENDFRTGIEAPSRIDNSGISTDALRRNPGSESVNAGHPGNGQSIYSSVPAECIYPMSLYASGLDESETHPPPHRRNNDLKDIPGDFYHPARG